MNDRFQNLIPAQAISAVGRLLSLSSRLLLVGDKSRLAKRAEEAIETTIGVLAVFAWLAAMTLLP